MHAHLAATLIVLFGHGMVLACEPVAAATTAPARADAPATPDAPGMMRTAGRSEPLARFTPREERAAPRSVPAAAPAETARGNPPRGNGATLLLVGLALMVGIAMRRRGAGHP